MQHNNYTRGHEWCKNDLSTQVTQKDYATVQQAPEYPGLKTDPHSY